MTDVSAQFREYIRLDRKQRGPGLSPKELERWMLLKRSLGQRFALRLSDEQADRRASLRVPARLRVDFPSVESLRGQVMTNISRGGLFVAVTDPPAIGTRLTLHLHVESTGERLEIPVEVVSHNVGPHYEAEPLGMGLRFLDMDATVKQQLEALYDESLRRALREQSGP